MTHIQIFRYRCSNGTPIPLDEETDSPAAPEELPDWPCDDDRSIAAIIITQNDSTPADTAITVDTSPGIIKGWKIYQMHTTRLTDGGMINDRQATFHLEHLEAHERRRIDILIKGPPGQVQVNATPR